MKILFKDDRDSVPDWKDMDIVEKLFVALILVAIVGVGLYVALVLVGPVAD